MKLASKKFPEGLIVGELPAFYGNQNPKDIKTGRSVASAASNVSGLSTFSTASKKTFDRDDIEKLNKYLDDSLMANNTTSRMTKGAKSTISTAASMSSVKTLQSIHEKPWKWLLRKIKIIFPNI